ncbi:MAG TPA: ACT domain-containing protein, partial [Bacillota bacterium]|nr:ACT domain-containing protein [Bacillota bacterium]
FKGESGVEVAGVDNLLTRMAKCCNPVPGDEIVGYITKGRGVTIHRTDCANIQSEDAKERFLDVRWKNDQSRGKQYHLDLEISAYDRNGLLNDVLQAVAELNTSISRVNGQADRNNMATIQMTVLIYNTDHLQKVVDRIKQVKDIYAVKRQMN